jgi:hypothetical protein
VQTALVPDQHLPTFGQTPDSFRRSFVLLIDAVDLFRWLLVDHRLTGSLPEPENNHSGTLFLRAGKAFRFYWVPTEIAGIFALGRSARHSLRRQR